ncbi:hypothetical protein PTSG_13238 [Salpingoeca rosetta]|uniref:Uncharacterized protein n=1 Tax=Salpingoeca rosetta (strain ATCC 50818 / BSB-021) TaxID=946362 RepID=F2TYI6_SALR5|nr:uncharacterized protein PTSG_13238 [Salpingoeca rosetta]EGD78660.1 hypothetical protein PTSG_13238 [Salpingoeca rosetta]|eukprot:XP_004997618.1 hypothetical protein PTSG_13238 [Salpingoeca rosetta]
MHTPAASHQRRRSSGAREHQCSCRCSVSMVAFVAAVAVAVTVLCCVPQVAHAKPTSMTHHARGRREHTTDTFECLYNGGANGTCNGTTRFIHEIFMGRCFDWIRQNVRMSASTTVDCFQAWAAFNASVRSDGFKFEPLLQLMPPETTEGTPGVLWSGLDLSERTSTSISSALRDAVRVITGEDGNEEPIGVALELTHVGYILDDLRFCPGAAGDDSDTPILPTEQGFNHQCCSFTDGPQGEFWMQASDWFANSFKEAFHILLNYRDGCEHAFRTDSILAHEVSQIAPCTRCDGKGRDCDKCSVHVWVVRRRACQQDKSIHELMQRLEGKNYRVECIDGQTDNGDKRERLVRAACEVDKNGELCTNAVSGDKKVKIAGIVVGALLGGMALGMAVYYAHRHFKLQKFLLQFDQSKEDKQLVLDDPDEWANTGYFPFEGDADAVDYNSSSLLRPMSSSG